MIFDYSVQRTFSESIDIVDIGNTALRCTEDDGMEYYVITRTIMGKFHIIKFGPVLPDIPVLIPDFTVSYKKFDYKEAPIFKEVDKFINDGRKKIKSVEEITEYEAWQIFPAIQEFFERA